jgi:hypothetical protein
MIIKTKEKADQYVEWRPSPKSVKRLSELMDAHLSARRTLDDAINLSITIRQNNKILIDRNVCSNEKNTVEMFVLFEKLANDICKSKKLASRANPVKQNQLIEIAFAMRDKVKGFLEERKIRPLDMMEDDGFWLPNISKILVNEVKRLFDNVGKPNEPASGC